MASDLVAHFRRCAVYNRLANARLYATCARLTDTQRRQDMGAFFGSIHRTLNHIMVGDRIWMTRFEGRTVPSASLDAILHDDFTALSAARAVEDARIETFFAGIAADFLAGSIAYINNAGLAYDDPLTVLLQHFFNHQTHHRGQVHAMITRVDRALAPVLDMHRVLIPEPGVILA